MGLKTHLFKPQYEKMVKARDESTITEVHNGRGSTMVEMALVACLFSACSELDKGWKES
jgi:hypothetical protein